MEFIYSFLFAGIVCLIGQIILDNTKLLPGHITSLFVVIGAALDTFSIYDLFVDKFGAGAIVCITSFGHLLIHGALAKAKVDGLLGLFTGMFSLTATGITATIIFAFIFTIAGLLITAVYDLKPGGTIVLIGIAFLIVLLLLRKRK